MNSVSRASGVETSAGFARGASARRHLNGALVADGGEGGPYLVEPVLDRLRQKRVSCCCVLGVLFVHHSPAWFDRTGYHRGYSGLVSRPLAMSRPRSEPPEAALSLCRCGYIRRNAAASSKKMQEIFAAEEASAARKAGRSRRLRTQEQC